MKLFHNVMLHVSAASVVVMTAWAVLFYWAIIAEVNDEVDDSLEDYSRRNGIIYLSLEVRESNLAARTLYAGCGWVESGMRKGFYSHPTENAVIMTRELS